MTTASHSGKEKSEHENDDDASVISFDPEVDQCKSITFRVILALIFIGIGALAMWYSLERGDDSNKKHNEFTPPPYFNIFVTQRSMNGTMTVIDEHGEKTIYDVEWQQNDGTMKLYHRVAAGDDWFQVYAFEHYSFKKTKDSCVRLLEVNYTSYLNSMGLNHLRRKRTESLKLAEDHYVPVMVYEGEPSPDVSYNLENPSLMFAFADPDSGATFGWQAYFTPPSLQYKLEYWFADIQHEAPDSDVFVVECV